MIAAKITSATPDLSTSFKTSKLPLQTTSSLFATTGSDTSQAATTTLQATSLTSKIATHTTEYQSTSQSFTTDTELINQEWIVEQLAGITLDQRIQLGFSFDDLILDCRFAGSQCDST
jgi:hypothetical protein